MPTQGGPAQPVVVQSSGPVQGGPAVPVVAMTDAHADRAIQGGPAIAVYDATEEVNAGQRAVQGGPAIPMAVRTGGGAVGGPAVPVYVVSGSLALSPADIPSLAGWYRAVSLSAIVDGGTITTWPDQSGNGRDLTQATAGARPTKQTVSGAPVVRTAAGKYLSNASLAVNSQALSVFIVAAPSSSASAQKIIGFGGANTIILNQFNGEWGGQSLIGVNDLWLSGLQVANTTFYIAGLRTDAAGAMTMYRSGTESARRQGHNADSVASASLTGLYVGTYSGLSNYFTGDIKEIIIYNRSLSDVEARQVVAYLAAQHGVSLTTSGPQVVFDGNSLTVGYVAFPGLTDVIIPQVAPIWRVRNHGLAGQTIEQMAASAAQIDALFSTAYKNILIVWEGTNALQALQNPTTVYNDIVAYCAARRAVGWNVVAGTLLPRTAAGVYVGFESDRQTINSAIRANYATFADALADVGNDATIGVAGASNNATYYSDKTHLTTAGYAIAATIFKTAINTL